MFLSLSDMKKVNVCAIIFNRTSALLLQKRDEAPGLGKWVLFGGRVEVGESEEGALRREIKEELDYELKNLHFFKRYLPDESNKIEQSIFVVDDSVELSELVLREGSEMKFFPSKEIANLDIGFNFKKIIAEYLTEN